jgi:hypothetical protein
MTHFENHCSRRPYRHKEIGYFFIILLKAFYRGKFIDLHMKAYRQGSFESLTLILLTWRIQ